MAVTKFPIPRGCQVLEKIPDLISRHQVHLLFSSLGNYSEAQKGFQPGICTSPDIILLKIRSHAFAKFFPVVTTLFLLGFKVLELFSAFS